MKVAAVISLWFYSLAFVTLIWVAMAIWSRL